MSKKASEKLSTLYRDKNSDIKDAANEEVASKFQDLMGSLVAAVRKYEEVREDEAQVELAKQPVEVSLHHLKDALLEKPRDKGTINEFLATIQAILNKAGIETA